MSRGVWRTLGIDPTTDRAAIRRAYAARLRAMDVDADPAGFEAVRDARDAALAHAADPAADPLPPIEDADGSADPAGSEAVRDARDAPPAHAANPVADPRPLARDADADPDPVADAAADDEPYDAEVEAFNAAIQQHFSALQALLFPRYDNPLTDEQAAAVAHHGGALLADPRLEQVDFAAGAERWFAEHLAASIPRSDPLLEAAAAVFGWIERRDDYALSPQARAIVERIGAIRYVTRLSDPKHRLHKAWVELTRPDDRRAPWFNSRKDRQELLATIRHKYPVAESWLNPQRVGEAEGLKGGSGGAWIWFAIFIAVSVARIALAPGDGDTPPARPEPIPVVQTTAPAPPPDPAEAEAAFVAPVLSGLTHAPDTLIREVTEWELKVMRYYQPFDPAQCVDTSLWRADARLSSDWDARRSALIDRIRASAQGDAPRPSSRRVTLPPGVMRTVARDTGFSPARMERALLDDKDVKDRCTVQIALNDALLALPPETGTPVLRQLQLSGFAK